MGLKGGPRPSEISRLIFWDSWGSILLEISGPVGASIAITLQHAMLNYLGSTDTSPGQACQCPTRSRTHPNTCPTRQKWCPAYFYFILFSGHAGNTLGTHWLF